MSPAQSNPDLPQTGTIQLFIVAETICTEDVPENRNLLNQIISECTGKLSIKLHVSDLPRAVVAARGKTSSLLHLSFYLLPFSGSSR
jgi:hypothetical protein